MAYNPVSGTAPQYQDSNSQNADGYYLKYYVANTTTPLPMATDSTGATTLIKCKLNPDGFPITNPLDNDTVFIPYVNQSYRQVIYRNEADADNNDTASALVNIAEVSPLVGGVIGTAPSEIPLNSDLYVDSLVDLPTVVTGQQINAAGYHAGTTVGGGRFVGIASGRHNGGTLIDPNRSAEIGTSAYYVDSGVDVSCWERVGVENITVDMFGGSLSSALATAKAAGLYVIHDEDVTYQVPTDSTTLQDIFDHAVSGGDYIITINIESGHQLTSGLNLRNRDFSYFSITSTDPTVTLDAAFVGADTSGIPAGILGEAPRAPFMLVALGAKSPILKTVIDMGNLYGTGIQVAEGTAIVDQGCGVINAGFRGIQVHGRANIYSATFNGASGTGIRLQQASTVNARSATADNCCSTDDLAGSAVYVSRSSLLEFRGGSAQNSGSSGLIARRSKVTADEANFDGAADKGVVAENCSEVSFSNGYARNTGSTSIRSIANSNIYAVGVESSTTTAAQNLSVDIGGYITLAGGNIIEGVAATESQVLAESNVSYLNAYDEAGMIFYDASNGTFKVTSNANGISQRFADGRMITFIAISIDTGTVASGNFSGQITMPTQPDTFVTVSGSNMTVTGRDAIGGGGSRVCVDNYYRGNVLTGSAWRIKNTGQQLDGAATAVSVQSIDVVMITYGTWR